MNPFVEFISEDQWKCNICKKINRILPHYNMPEDERGNILNNELNSGTCEFLTYKNFLNKERQIIYSCYYFLIDISQISINSGFTQCVLESIKDSINNNYYYNYDNLDIKICIITYEKQINFYPINNNIANSGFNMLSINELSDNLFLPTKKEFLLVELKKYKNKIIQIIESI